MAVNAKTNLNDTTPAAPSGRQNWKWQATDYTPDANGVLIRNASVNGPNVGGVNLQSGTTYTIQASDQGKLVVLSNAGAVAVTLPTASGFDAGFTFEILTIGAGTVTVTPTISTINGAASLTFQTGQGGRVFSDSTNYHAQYGRSSAGSAVWGSITGTLSSQTDLNTALGLKAPLASPALTGVPTAPTAAAATNTTQLATCAFVESEIATASGVGGVANFFAWGGDGSDGALVYDGSTTILGVAPVATVYTLTRDIFASSVTINSGVTIKTGNFAIFCSGTLTVNGTIRNNGGNGLNAGNSNTSSGTAGQNSGAPAEGSAEAHYPGLSMGDTNQNTGTGASGATGAGAQAAAPTAGLAVSAAAVSGGSTGTTGSSGGKGGTGTSGAGGAARTGSAGGSVTAAVNNGREPQCALRPVRTTFSGGTVSQLPYGPKNGFPGNGSGGSGGGGDGVNPGGGGGGSGSRGGNGGFVAIFAFTIIVGASGSITSNGGNGGNGGNGATLANGNVGGGGGGAGGNGGNGGIMWLVFHTKTNGGIISANGGAGGSGGSKGAPHGTGTDDATNGSAGSNGLDGEVVQIQC